MTKLEYWKSVQDGNFIQACKNAGINLVSTNVSDARAEFMKLDFSSIYPGLNSNEINSKVSSLFLVGLKLKNLSSYEWGKFLTLTGRICEEAVFDYYIPVYVDFEKKFGEFEDYVIKACRNIVKKYPIKDIIKARKLFSSEYSDFDVRCMLDWAQFIYYLMNDGDECLEIDAYILGKSYDLLKSEGIEESLIIQDIDNRICDIASKPSHYHYNYDNTLRPYILNEDPKYKDNELEDEFDLLNILSNFKYGDDMFDDDKLDELLDEDPDDYEDENDEEDDEETEYEIEMKAVEASENIVSNSCQSVKLETEPESSPISVEQIVESQPAKIEIPDYNGLTVVSNLIKVAESDSLRDDHMQGLFTVGMNGNEIKLLVDITGGIYLEKEVLDRLGKEYIKGVLIRFTTPNGSYSEDLEFFNKWNKVVGFLKMMSV